MVWARWLMVAGVFGFLAVALGAFGAHALKPRFSAKDLEIFETGNRYHFYHTLALLCTALFMTRIESLWLKSAAVAFTTGIVIFSGSLYTLVLLQKRWMGAVTPFGGLALLAGWTCLIIAASKIR